MITTLFAIGISVIIGFIGSLIGGYIEEQLYLAVEGIIPDCDKLEGQWKETCHQTHKAYYTGKSTLQLAGFVTGFGGMLGILKKLGL